MERAKALLDSAKASMFYAHIVVSPLTGARTEELRALRWSHVDLDGQPDAVPPVPSSIQVWRSARAGGDTKTRKSRRTLAPSGAMRGGLRRHRRIQDRKRAEAGRRWQNNDLVFCTALGGELLAGNVRPTFRRLTGKAGIGDDWTPRELRHSFVSLLSSSGVRIEDIADLCGHA
jgi:integrase